MKRSNSRTDLLERLKRLVNKATKTGENDIDAEVSKEIASLVKGSDPAVLVLCDILWEQLNTLHSQIRLLTVCLIDYFFMRSVATRKYFVDRFNDFLKLSVGTDDQLPLPEPKVWLCCAKGPAQKRNVIVVCCGASSKPHTGCA